MGATYEQFRPPFRALALPDFLDVSCPVVSLETEYIEPD